MAGELVCRRQALVSWVLFEGALAGSVTRWPLRGREKGVSELGILVLTLLPSGFSLLRSIFLMSSKASSPAPCRSKRSRDDLAQHLDVLLGGCGAPGRTRRTRPCKSPVHRLCAPGVGPDGTARRDVVHERVVVCGLPSLVPPPSAPTSFLLLLPKAPTKEPGAEANFLLQSFDT